MLHSAVTMQDCTLALLVLYFMHAELQKRIWGEAHLMQWQGWKAAQTIIYKH